MTSHPSPRQELVCFQQEIYEEVKRLARSFQPQLTPSERRYESEYERQTQHYERPATQQELLHDLSQSAFAYFADYHTARQSQKIPLWVLTKLLEQRDTLAFHRPIVLLLEMFYSKDQPWVDQYLAGSLTEKDFLEMIHYSKTWGFHWQHYKVLLDFARAHRLPVVGLNVEVKSRYGHLQKRDRHAARLLVNLWKKDPQALLVTLYGELHVAEPHLPQQVRNLLAQKGEGEQPHVIIYQNSESIYWNLVHHHLENTDLVKIKERTYCVMNTTPLVRLQSFIHWQKREEELHCSSHPNWCEVGESLIDLVDEVSDLIERLCHFWEYPPPNLDDLSVYTTHDLAFIEKTLQNVLGPDEIEKIKIQLARQESYFLTGRHTIFLTNLSLNHAAEEAMHYLHFKELHLERDPDLPPHDRFYFRLLCEAIGFLGSKIINPKRKCYKIQDFEDFLIRVCRKRLSDPHLRDVRRISQYVLKHHQREKDYLGRGVWTPLRQFYTLSFPDYISVSHALGYILGDRLYLGFTQNLFTKKDLKAILEEPIAQPGRAFSLYLYLLKQTRDVQENYLRKDELP